MQQKRTQKLLIIEWDSDDLLCLDPSLSENDCSEILSLAEIHHDCDEGITRDVLRYWIDYFKNTMFRR